MKNKGLRYLFKALAGTATAAFAIQGALLLGLPHLLPTAEDFLISEGLDPAIAATLSDKPIRVLERNVPGTLLMLANFPYNAGTVIKTMDDPYAAFSHSHPSLSNECYVVIPTPNAEDVISHVTGRDIHTTKVTDQDMRLVATLHEFRHCHSDNKGSHADADWHAITTAAQETGHQDIIKAEIYARTLYPSWEDHDIALYLDAALHKNSLPTLQDMHKATKQAYDYAGYYLRDADNLNHFLAGDIQNIPARDLADAFNSVLFFHDSNLEPLTRRRTELYIEAVQYFGLDKPPAPSI